MAHPQIAAFARLAKGGATPNRLVAGQDTKLSRTMHDIRYDAANDEFLVTNPFAQAILIFAGGADGNQPPARIIQGPSTRIGDPDRLDVDPAHDEIIIPNETAILVFSRKASGNAAPLRVIEGPDTMLRRATSAAVDPVHNLIIVGLNQGGRRGTPGALLIFNRTDNGNVKPRAVIRGPKSGITRINQIALYPEKGWIVATQPGEGADMEPEGAFIGVWSINDNGDVPPRWKINANAKSAMKKPRGVVLDPKNKEMIVADMRLNSIITYYFPEIF
ncbi:MAG: hypothetical protein A3H28_01985 [Acidobacteria bacterium RIFCSPLOWO2_02_FULL_61_28]|nr:MAG: hypothetical protein A3H28_01985 [Acidobacteria bacterium RIFCSPLOWO2_02_FULL_61_28]